MKTLENAPVLKTELVAYYFNTSDEKQRAEYAELCEKLRATNGPCFNVLASGHDKLRSGSVYLETRHMFDNQWNTTDNSPTNSSSRVFDWFEAIYSNQAIKCGHYLVLTDEIKQLRDNVKKCGYCGAMHWASKGLTFCDQCLGSGYLKEDDLKLVRLRCISDRSSKFPELTEAERAYLLPLYIAAQTEGADTHQGKVLEKQRANLRKDYEKAINKAETKYKGFNWLMDKRISLENCIYYDHTNTFSFGWRQPLSANVKERLAETLKDFPFPYEIKGEGDK